MGSAPHVSVTRGRPVGDGGGDTGAGSRAVLGGRLGRLQDAARRTAAARIAPDGGRSNRRTQPGAEVSGRASPRVGALPLAVARGGGPLPGSSMDPGGQPGQNR